jgi:hypothetical protein
MVSTACATTATAATLSPCSQPLSSALPSEVTPWPNSTSAIADGSVKPVQAASPPA